MATLLLAEHDNRTLDPRTARAVTAARALGAEIHILVAGAACADVAAAARQLTGVSRVLRADDPALADGRAEPLAALLVSLAAGYHAILAVASSTGKNVLPRAAALLDVMQISDVVDILGPDLFRRPIYAGNAIETVQSTDRIKLVTIRASAFAETPPGGNAEIVTVTATADPTLSRHLGHSLARTDRPELTSARAVISGGRAFGSKDDFDRLLGPLAARLNAAIGASRAAVDAGYAANELQVGQTGKIVAPDLYIAIGISGAIQHLAGMKESRVIVAINTDPNAPIFQHADFCLVGDLFELLPELTALL